MIGSITVEPGATLTLLLDDKNYITNHIRVSAGATIIIDSLNKNNVTDCLTIASGDSKNTNAGIGGEGGEGGDATKNKGKNGGTITINGGTIDIVMSSTGAGIGGGGGYNTGENGVGGTVGHAGNGGLTTINGGNIKITQNGSSHFKDSVNNEDTVMVSGAGIGGGGSAGFNDSSGGGNAGTVVITGGNVTIRQKTRAAGIGGGTYGTAGHITISGGIVDIEVNSNKGGAGIGGCGSSSPRQTSAITITGGTVKAVADYTGIGIVNSLDDLSIVITGGEVFAKGGTGPGIGFLVYSDGHQTRSIKITGGKVTAVSDYSSGIGTQDNRGVGPPFELNASADVRAYSGKVSFNEQDKPISTTSPAIYTKEFDGNGYIVNAGISDSLIIDSKNTSGIDLYVFANGQTSQTSQILKSLTLPANYKFFAYSSAPNASRTDNVFYSHLGNSGLLVQEGSSYPYSNDDKKIFSVKEPTGYNNYNSIKNKFWLPLKPAADGKIYVVYKSNNSTNNAYFQPPDKGQSFNNVFTVLSNLDTGIKGTKGATEFQGWNTAPDGTGESYEIGRTFTISNNKSLILYAQWDDAKNPILTISKTVSGFINDPSTEFTFRVYIYEESDGCKPVSDVFNAVITDTSEITDTPEIIEFSLQMVDGVGEFTLRHGQKIEIFEIPYGCWVRIEEIDVPNEYSVKFLDSINNGIMEKMSYSSVGESQNWSTGELREILNDRVFHITNVMAIAIPTHSDIGDAGALLPILAFSLASILGLAIYSEVNKFRRKETYL